VRRTALTREGKRFLVALFLIAVAAANTGNNLIYLILSLMFSLLLLAFVILKLNLGGLSIGVSHEGPLFAKEETSLRVLVRNGKRLFTSYSVNCVVPGAFAPVYFAAIPPAGSAEKEVQVKFERRGLYRYGDFQVLSGFPFVLLSRAGRIRVAGEALVYPALHDVEGMLRDAIGGENADVLSASGDEMHSLREFRYGDDWRKIHWKASAKTGKLYAKEYADHESTRMTVVLDNLLPEGGQLFEIAVSLTGSFARYFIEKGYFVRVVSSQKIIPFGRGEEHLFKILDILAMIREEQEWDSPIQDGREGPLLTVLKSRGRLNPYASVGGVAYAEDI
jgi:uncharacterized protein (DUF58 family)